MSSVVGSTPWAMTTLPAGAASATSGKRARHRMTTTVHQWFIGTSRKDDVERKSSAFALSAATIWGTDPRVKVSPGASARTPWIDHQRRSDGPTTWALPARSPPNGCGAPPEQPATRALGSRAGIMLGMDAFLTTEGLIALATLTAMEIVLGIDNVVFIAILVGRLPSGQ